ncbi:MAG: TRAP transporter TatT component family protein [Candidatus Aminicenantes bacterium]|nr:TRAP transporter TatT component family protein [Candidatus Aminicenantes bacterium]MDH5466567.1 TRAP transporter TatT component family protein [Candidatus Aminicenantes bacterium]MDH5705171.1 TRAP transporter TatT component family protein [Candidatus Aminicenantes bacterium]
MKAKTFFLIILFFSFSVSLFSQSVEELIAQADQLYLEMRDMATAEKARDLYLKARDKAEDKYEPFWKLSRIYYYIGDNAQSSKDKKIIFSQGIYYAERAAELEPEKPDGYYWLGVNYGVYGEARGVLKSLFLVDDIKRAMNKVVELERSYEEGGPDRVLGRMYFKLPGFAGGSNDKSAEHLLKSLEYGPNDPLTRYYLADTYLALKEVEKARTELEFILNLESDDRWVSGVNDCKKDAEEMLKKKQFQK